MLWFFSVNYVINSAVQPDLDQMSLQGILNNNMVHVEMSEEIIRIPYLFNLAIAPEKWLADINYSSQCRFRTVLPQTLKISRYRFSTELRKDAP